ncbi:hypothetical protein O0Z71_06060 [Ligilactobacillus saerimneri]|uniref:hypothetical protein n=1 Tax=Ligilactobacillus saerimneri TaxID=228229 RepID=UPI0022A67F1F|nr:hypothetical protein [Ligilactobacillus saerimneri]MCZ0892004.1 hypothetical protein [Ligilactobacillus saerimneri]
MFRRYKRLQTAYLAVIMAQIIVTLILSTWFSRLLGTIAGIPLVVSVLAGMWTLGEDLFD